MTSVGESVQDLCQSVTKSRLTLKEGERSTCELWQVSKACTPGQSPSPGPSTYYF